MYDVFGFTVPPAVTELFKDNPDELWKTMSVELLPEYAGDRIFLVQDDGDEVAQEATDALTNGTIWQSIPAVQNGKVYLVPGRWGLNDPLTLDWLLDEMAKVLAE
jgi:iron complex transport system substrate-binding protein